MAVGVCEWNIGFGGADAAGASTENDQIEGFAHGSAQGGEFDALAHPIGQVAGDGAELHTLS